MAKTAENDPSREPKRIERLRAKQLWFGTIVTVIGLGAASAGGALWYKGEIAQLWLGLILGVGYASFTVGLAFIIGGPEALRLILSRHARGLARLLVPAIESPGYSEKRVTSAVDLDKIESLLDRKLTNVQSGQLQLDASERAALTSSISEAVARALTNESLEDLRKRIGATRLNEALDTTKRRLSDAIEKTASRTTNNLAFGIAFSIMAVGILFMSLGANELKTTPELLRYFVPRISVVLLVELVAYLFLKLYRSGIDEIRYYQNELTNFEAKAVALEAALVAGNEALAKEVVTQLSATERNFILHKGATTVELERAKLQQDHSVEVVKALTAIIKSK